MTVTEDAPAAVLASSEPIAPTPAPTGLAAVLGSGDHKVVGRLWIAAAMVHRTGASGTLLTCEPVPAWRHSASSTSRMVPKRSVPML